LRGGLLSGFDPSGRRPSAAATATRGALRAPAKVSAVADLETIADTLRAFYGALPAPPSDPFALFVWEVLSARASYARRDAAMAALKRIRALTPDALARAPRKKLEEAVALAGSHRDERLQALTAGADAFRRAPDLPRRIRGPLRDAWRALRALPYMTPDAACRMRLFAAGQRVLPVDARVTRVVTRLGIVDAAGSRRPATIRRALDSRLPADLDAYRQAHLYLIHHAEATCTARDPHCGICPLRAGCPEGLRRAH